MRNAAMLALPMCVLGPAALAQSAAPLPSQVAPQDRRPPIESGTARVAPLPQASPASAAAAADLHVTLAAVDVTGAFDDVPRRDDPFAAIVGRSASLSEIQQAVAVLQAQYDEAGYALVRIVLPPQTLRDGGRMQVRVIDGYIESVEADAVP
ncbi:MAG: POTRA domain-containing protein, partial [Vitreoscilla sp.]